MKTLAAIAVVAFVLVAYYAGGLFGSRTVLVYNSTGTVAYEPYRENMTGGSASVIVPAVDQDGNGVPTVLLVQLVPGTGKILVNIDRLIFWADTQDSIRTAKEVAQLYLNMDETRYDIIYTIKANASVIEGPSAGGALTIATIAALQGRQPNRSVMMTGTITPDGRIGPIGEALAKARAAKQIGAQLFVVPRGQSIETRYDAEKKCSQFGATEVCRVENVPHQINIEEEAGIDVVEASTIGDAVAYFLG